ncbi:unnamed protein product [Trichobilharzia szidati]|nr:unnamed protein product [Trichobilharzia szidati]
MVPVVKVLNRHQYLEFNDHNERIAGHCLLKQGHFNTTAPIIMRSNKSCEETQEQDQKQRNSQSYDPFSHMLTSDYVSNKYDWKTTNAPFLYDEAFRCMGFGQNMDQR